MEAKFDFKIVMTILCNLINIEMLVTNLYHNSKHYRFSLNILASSIEGQDMFLNTFFMIEFYSTRARRAITIFLKKLGYCCSSKMKAYFSKMTHCSHLCI